MAKAKKGRRIMKSVWYNMFHYSDYWHTWSRVLRFEDWSVVEVNLTPINSDWQKDVEPIRIRKHGTMDERRDWLWQERSKRMTVDFVYRDGLYLSDSLPISVISAMEKAIGLPLVQRLLKEDFYSKIDWNKYRSANELGGGVPFDLCSVR